MNNTTNTPIFDAVGTNNNIGFEWGTTNPALSVLKTIITNNEQTYHIPKEGGIKTPFGDGNSISGFVAVSTAGLANSGGVLAPNGKIYAVPASASSIMEIDVENKSITLFGSISTSNDKYVGGVLAPNGNIYCMPKTAQRILEINPYSRKVTEYWDTLNSIPTCKGTVLGPNGKVYGIGYQTSANACVEFDPKTFEYSNFGNAGGNLFAGGVLAPNGKIYCIPESTATAGIIDPLNKTLSTFTVEDPGGTNNKCFGGVLAPNGKIYCAPFNATKILVIDTLSNDSYTIGSFSTSTSKWKGGALAPDGHIYFMPANATNTTLENKIILRVNWLYDTYDFVPIPATFFTATYSNGWGGAVLTPNGKLVGIPNAADYAIVLDFNTTINENACLSNVVNNTF